ncbi:hypothetical protein LCGC14_1321630 [marine sediment metagenome]|uniref:Putative exodeoxyribonuclease 8 PDDEXK-like domain-containing protein n=1 Tax=marine sediment metagenome TaxID=412755 RepID=A0A0F9N017_9ZZZZ
MQPATPEHWECTNDEYHACPGVSRSMLQDMDNPLLFYQRHVAKTEPRKKITPSLKFGHDAHDIVLCPDGMGRNVIEIPRDSLSANGARMGKAWVHFRNDNAGKLLLKPAEFEPFERIMASIRGHDDAMTLFNACEEVEYAIRWTDRATGLLLRCKIDLLLHTCILDFKTAADVDARAFNRSIEYPSYAPQGYDYQAAFYRMGVKAMFGDERPFRCIASRNRAPYNCELFTLSAEHLAIGEEKVHRDLRTLAECKASGRWGTATYGKNTELSPSTWAEASRKQYEVE